MHKICPLNTKTKVSLQVAYQEYFHTGAIIISLFFANFRQLASRFMVGSGMTCCIFCSQGLQANNYSNASMHKTCYQGPNLFSMHFFLPTCSCTTYDPLEAYSLEKCSFNSIQSIEGHLHAQNTIIVRRPLHFSLMFAIALHQCLA